MKPLVRWVVTSGSSKLGKPTAFLRFGDALNAVQSGGGAVYFNQKTAELLAGFAKRAGWKRVRVVKVNIIEVAE